MWELWGFLYNIIKDIQKDLKGKKGLKDYD